MPKKDIIKIISIWVIVISFFHTSQQYNLPFGGFAFTLLVDIFFLYVIFISRKQLINGTNHEKKDFKWLKLFLFFVIVNSIRGIFAAENYYEYKHLLQGFLYSIIPIFLVLFLKKENTSYIWKRWYKYSLLIYFLYFLILIKFDPFYLSPLYFLFCFFPLFKKHKLLIITAAIIFILTSYAIDARAALGKGVISILFGCSIYFLRLISNKLIKQLHNFLYFSFILVFAYVFSDFIGIMTGQLETKETNATEEYGVDTRSLLYYDIINSAVENEYYVWGRTPARGNDIIFSGKLFLNDKTNTEEFSRDERHANEVLHGNIFTWYGIIGVLLYFMIYYKASSLAVNHSNNIYIKLLGCYVAFRWTCGWIEDVNNFDIANIALWSMIGMCYSKEFRNMTNKEFKQWINTII